MKNSGKYVLAVDLGTTGPKTALVSVYGEIVDSEFQETPVILLPDGGAEQDPQCWWNAIMYTAKKVIGKNLVSTDDIIAVSATSQWSGTVPLTQSGDHLMNAVIWMDSRGSEPVKKILKGFPSVQGYPLFKLLTWLRLTGGIPAKSGKDSLCHILWLKQNCPEIYNNTYKFLETKDYINFRLTGKFSSTFDTILLHWVTDNRDPSRITYSEKLLEMAGIERSKLPDLIQAMDILGPVKKEVAQELGLNPDTPVIGGSPDAFTAAIGSGAVRDYEGHLYVGTSSWIEAHVPFKKTDLFHNFGSFPSPIPGKYMIITDQESAGKCLTWLRDNILYHKNELMIEERVPDVYKVLDKIVERVPAGANNVLFTPWLYGERTPIEDSHIRSSIINLSLENTQSDIARAVYEGVAFNSKWLMMPLEKYLCRPFEYLNFIGGGANSDVWAQIFSDVLNRKIRQVKGPIYANARGAAFLASMALKYITLEDIPQYIPIKAEYTPNPDNRKIYDELFNEFVNHYKAQRKACVRMNKNTAGSISQIKITL